MFTKKNLAVFTVLVVLSLFALMSISGVIAQPAQAVVTVTASKAGSINTYWNCSIPKGSAVGVIAADTAVFFNPNTTDKVGGITLKAGSKWYIVGQTGNYFKLSLVNNCVYVPTSAIASAK